MIETYFYVISEIIGHYAPDNVEADVASSVSHMRLVVNSRTARVPSNLVRIIWHKLVFLLCERVEHSKLWLLLASCFKVMRTIDDAYFVLPLNVLT